MRVFSVILSMTTTRTFLLLLSSLPSQAAPPGSCSTPANPPYGEWICSSSHSTLSCSLECDPGWIVQGRSTVSCVDGQWSQPGVNYGCTAVEAVVIAGNADPVPNTIGLTVELYGKYHGNDLSKEQRKLPGCYQARFESTLNFVNYSSATR